VEKASLGSRADKGWTDKRGSQKPKIVTYALTTPTRVINIDANLHSLAFVIKPGFVTDVLLMREGLLSALLFLCDFFLAMSIHG
jgi:hypothetical protein